MYFNRVNSLMLTVDRVLMWLDLHYVEVLWVQEDLNPLSPALGAMVSILSQAESSNH
jgi:hypothetical protein